MPLSSRILSSLVLSAVVLCATPASADWRFTRFGQSMWFGYTMGQGWLLDSDQSSDALSMYTRIGARIAERFALEFAAGVTGDTYVDKGGAGFALLLTYFPGVDWARVSLGPKFRVYSEDPRNSADRKCTAQCERFVSTHSTDVGLELGASTQWNWGAFYIGLDWVSLYMPVAVVSGYALHYEGRTRIGKTALDPSVIDPVPELRLLNVAFGLTF